MKRSRRNKLTLDSRVRSLALKFYAETLFLPKARATYISLRESKLASDQVKANFMEKKACEYMRDRITKLDPSFMCAGIYHNRDLVQSKDDPFEPAIKKGHWHVLLWRKDHKRFRLRDLISYLGIVYDHERDASMWISHGAETIQDVSSYIMYLTHETAQAIREGKEEYRTDEIAKNFSDDELEQLRAGYKRVTRKKRMTSDDWLDFENEAYERAHKLQDFDHWARETLTPSQRGSSVFKACERTYRMGLSEGIAAYGPVMRVSILIYGAGGIGKSYTIRETMRRMGLKALYVPDKTGKYDYVTPDTDALVFDDVGASNSLNVFDNQPTLLHRRNSADGIWKGNWAIVNTNVCPSQWIKHALGITGVVVHPGDPGYSCVDPADRADAYEIDRFDALSQRLYFCTVAKGHLVVEKVQERGDRQAHLAHNREFLRFKEIFDSISVPYWEKNHPDDLRKLNKALAELKRLQSRSSSTKSCYVLDDYRYTSLTPDDVYVDPNLEYKLLRFAENHDMFERLTGDMGTYWSLLSKRDQLLLEIEDQRLPNPSELPKLLGLLGCNADADANDDDNGYDEMDEVYDANDGGKD